MKRLFNFFVKLTAWPVQWLCFRTKVYYEDKKAQSRRIKGAGIIVSNHTSVYDYAVFLFVFFGRMLRYQMAECLFRKKSLRRFLKLMGGIFVDRDSYDFAFVKESLAILNKKGVVGIFPESRLPKEGEDRPLEFKTSATYIALESGAPIIPVYTNGSYFRKARARVMIGRPINARELWRDELDEKTNINNITAYVREQVIRLKDELGKRTEKNKKSQTVRV